MSADENKALIRRFVETVWNNKQIDALDELHAAEFTFNGEPFTTEKFKEGLRGYFQEVPDLQNTIQDMIAEGNKVTYRWIMRSTNQTTGKRQVMRGITFNRIEDGKIVEDWYDATELPAD